MCVIFGLFLIHSFTLNKGKKTSQTRIFRNHEEGLNVYHDRMHGCSVISQMKIN